MYIVLRNCTEIVWAGEDLDPALLEGLEGEEYCDRSLVRCRPVVNLTPHPIVLRWRFQSTTLGSFDHFDQMIPASGLARVSTIPGSQVSKPGEFPVYGAPAFGDVAGLAEYDLTWRRCAECGRPEQDDCLENPLDACSGSTCPRCGCTDFQVPLFIVSAMVAARFPGRDNVVSPGTGPNDEAVRDDKGQIVAVTRLIRAPAA